MMRVFECPKCKERGRALASTMMHRCSWNKNQMTEWVEMRDEVNTK